MIIIILQIEDLFGPEYKSHIEAMRLLYDQTEQQNFRGIAVVRFDTEESAYNAMKAFSNCQLTDPVSKITSSLQLKPWRWGGGGNNALGFVTGGFIEGRI